MATRSSGGELHGLLIVDKPAGMTSHDVVSKIRRLTGERKVGHGGTLDPMATGVLPVAIGDATRVIEYLAGSGKRYRAEIVFGIETDTLDADGKVSVVHDASFMTIEHVEAALSEFRRAFAQIPPMHSAIKIDGVKLYDLARRGIEIERVGRDVSVHELVLLDWSYPVATIDVACSKGFYVRSLARDLGYAVGIGAHLGNLVRSETGPFSLADAWRFDELNQLDREGIREQWATVALHPAAMMDTAPVIILSRERAAAWAKGMESEGDEVFADVVSVYAEDGSWLGVGRGDPERGQWVPEKVIVGRNKSERNGETRTE